MVGMVHTSVFVAPPCGRRDGKQGYTHAVHMVSFLAPVARHHVRSILCTSAPLAMHRPASVVPPRVEGGVEDWKRAMRHILHLLCASRSIAPLEDYDATPPQLHDAQHVRCSPRLQGGGLDSSHHDAVSGLEGSLWLGPSPSPDEAVPLLIPLLGDGNVAHRRWHHPLECLASRTQEDLHLFIGGQADSWLA